ncbi:MAG TPA: aldehyde ferredoxin oxidoreductase N-terminal domain-containing protein [Deltaproteobacteria bacterium]|nr:aldehyde ferredoxin oxidoreductase N-terminal domain-containing protein [Deltaproteobacteria bacterium]HPJ94956.1 aldehyde ferredoxin oxidoreductase N-terminal domain-containing protein [Deltaproteobacteria bacterium]
MDKKIFLKVLIVDAASGFYRVKRYELGDFFGPVDLGLHLCGRFNSLNIATGLLAGSIFPGSNRLIFTSFSPCWGGFFISSMGGAGLVFDNLGIDMLSIVNRSSAPSVLYLNRIHGEEIQVEVHALDIFSTWKSGRGGVYSIMDHIYENFGHRYEDEPRILATGPAAIVTDFGSICSAPISRGKVSYVDTWAGRGGLGTKMLKEHGIAAVIYGGTYIDEDFRDRKVADQWFENKYNQKLAAKDFEATTKYRFDPKFSTGGTFGVNYTTIGGSMLSFNYTSIYLDESERLKIHDSFIINHYLKQFNEETIETKQQRTCGEPCSAVCKKMLGEYKKDYEPYQAMGPLCGIFDQRAAEQVTHRADMYGFDAISVGGVLSWLMECLAERLLSHDELGIPDLEPVFSHHGFRVVEDSLKNSQVAMSLLDAIIEKRGIIDLSEGARKCARRISREKSKDILDRFLYASFARKGWMVPNQYWTPGVFSPMSIMGKYYMHYGKEFLPPRELGRKDAHRFQAELTMDNLGICRFHRAWAEDMIPEIVESLYGLKKQFLANNAMTASRISSRNASIFWESERVMDFIHLFLKRKHDVDGVQDRELLEWIDRFDKDKHGAALDFWYEIHKGISESLREF